MRNQESTAYYGKYRGVVANRDDPLQLGRLQVTVPAVFGADGRAWAMPCLPYAGPAVGFLARPPVDACVWVEFEAGDPDHPIWSGCFWAPEQVPPEAGDPRAHIFKTEGWTIRIPEGDSPGEGITIETASGTRIVVDESGRVTRSP